MRRKKTYQRPKGLLSLLPLLGGVAVLSFCSSTRSHPASSCSRRWSWALRWWLSSSLSPPWCHPRSLAAVLPCSLPPAPSFSPRNPPREQLHAAVVGVLLCWSSWSWSWSWSWLSSCRSLVPRRLIVFSPCRCRPRYLRRFVVVVVVVVVVLVVEIGRAHV